jgi:hypothetical protein
MSPMSPRTLRPRASGFDPRSISGLKIWLDAANTSSMTFNGSTVSQVNDLSGNGFHATQGTANNQPTYQATGFNSKPTLYFDSTDSILSSGTIADFVLTPTTSPGFALVMACYMPAFSSGGNISFGSDVVANGRIYFSSHFDLGGGNRSIFFDVVNATTGRISSGSQTDTGWTSPHIFTAYRFGSAMAVRRNGTVLASRADASGNFSATTAKFLLGKAFDLAATQMYMSECVIYAASLSGSQITTIERGLAKKWGITLA